MHSSSRSYFKRGAWTAFVCVLLAWLWHQSDATRAPLGVATAVASGEPPHASIKQAITPEPVRPAAVTVEDAGSYVDPVSALGQAARGLYFSGNAAAALGADGLAHAVKTARMNAAVIDIKDERGHIMFDTKVPELSKSKRIVIDDLGKLVREVRSQGVYVIGRIVCFSDPIVLCLYPERAIQDGRPYKAKQGVWASWARRNTWLDPYNTDNHAMLVALAKEAEGLGFDEIQLDYIRFPVDEATKWAVFPAQGELPRHEVLLGLLAKIDRAVHIPLGVDVFGLTTMPWGQPEPLGQRLDLWTKHVEVISPMLYVNGMRAWMQDDLQTRAERLIAIGVTTLRKRVGDVPVIRPFLQGFPYGADHYDTDFITQQIRGARRANADGFLFWHPASHYAMVREAARGSADMLMPFPNVERAEARRTQWDSR